MIKLNNKGLGHHLVIIVVAVLAVVGAAGYFVWNSQKDKGIDAKAAGYTYRAVASMGMGAALTKGDVAYMACAQNIKSNTYQINTYFRNSVSGGKSSGWVKLNGKDILTFSVKPNSTYMTSKRVSGANTKLEFGGTWYSSAKNSTLPLLNQQVTVADMMPCDKANQTANYKYELITKATNIPGVEFYACKSAAGADSWKLETKLVSTTEAMGWVNNTYDKSFEISTDNIEWVGIPSYAYSLSPITKGTTLRYSGMYDLNNMYILPEVIKNIESVASCI